VPRREWVSLKEHLEICSRAKSKKPSAGYKASSKHTVPLVHYSKRWEQHKVASELTSPTKRHFRNKFQLRVQRLGRRGGGKAFIPFYTLPVDKDGNSYFLLSQLITPHSSPLPAKVVHSLKISPFRRQTGYFTLFSTQIITHTLCSHKRGRHHFCQHRCCPPACGPRTLCLGIV
jgi:hypothetical protein